MDKITAQKILPIIQHIAEHGEGGIEYLNNAGVWVRGSGCMIYKKPDRYRIKPKPTTRPWNCPEDVPGPVCWLRNPCGYCVMVIGITTDGPICVGTSAEGYGVNHPYRWANLSVWDHSTDMQTWHPCTTTEEQP